MNRAVISAVSVALLLGGTALYGGEDLALSVNFGDGQEGRDGRHDGRDGRRDGRDGRRGGDGDGRHHRHHRHRGWDWGNYRYDRYYYPQPYPVYPPLQIPQPTFSLAVDSATVAVGQPINIRIYPGDNRPVTIFWSIDGGRIWSTARDVVSYVPTYPGPITFVIYIVDSSGARSQTMSAQVNVLPQDDRQLR